MQTRPETTQAQQQKIAASLIRANALLQCAADELLQIVEIEQRTNPVLEAIDDIPSRGDCGRCPFGGRPACSTCLYTAEGEGDTPGDAVDSLPIDDLAFDDDLLPLPRPGAAGDDFDRLAFAPAPSTLAQEIRWQLGASEGERVPDRVAEYLIDSLDSQGYLRLDPVEACALLKIAPEELDRAIRILQACDPPGIGARSLQECLRLQIELWPESHDDPPDSLALTVVRDHWDLFAHGQRPLLARQLQVTVERLDQAAAFIRTRLTPYPAGQYREPFGHRPDGVSGAIRPDVVIRRTAHGFAVEIPPTEQLSLRVNPEMRAMAQRLRRAGRQAEDAAELTELVGRADALLAGIRRRQWTIKKIAAAIAERQQGFLETGRKSFLRPLTRTAIARELDLHESIVSRALRHKYIRLPTEEVVPFDCFFQGAASERDVIAALIAGEDRGRPLSDQAIADTLAERGMPTARRTVAKYRDEMRLPAAHLRRVR